MPLEQEAIATVINAPMFRRRAGNNAKHIREHIDLFQRVYPRKLAEVRHAARVRDCEALRAAAQALSQTVANFAAEPAMRALAALEEKVSCGDSSGIDDCYYIVENEMDRLYDTLMTFDLGGGQ